MYTKAYSAYIYSMYTANMKCVCASCMTTTTTSEVCDLFMYLHFK